MADHRFRDDAGEPPSDGAAPISPHAAQTRMLASALESTLRDCLVDLRRDVADLRREVGALTLRASDDFRNLLYIFGAGFVLVTGILAVGYFRLDDRLSTELSKTNEQVSSIGTTTTKIDTKLDDLLARIPPAITPVQRR